MVLCIYVGRVPNLRSHKAARGVLRRVQDVGGSETSTGCVGNLSTIDEPCCNRTLQTELTKIYL